MHVTKTSEILTAQRDLLVSQRDNEISTASECLSQYVTDHNDKAAYRDIDRQVNQLARAWDKMISKLTVWIGQAELIEQSCENFYGN